MDSPAIGSGSDGYLQLTDNSSGSTGATVYDRAFPATAGLQISFDEYQYAVSGKGLGAADGIGFFLTDGSYSLTAPGPQGSNFGGALGYATIDDQPGVQQGYLGLGLDVYGNYERQPYVGTACPVANNNSRVSNSVGLRGPGNGTDGYCLLGNTAYSGLENAPATAPGGATGTPQRVTVTVSPTTASDPYPAITVDINGVTVLTEKMTTPAPPTMKFGFAASTGQGHEVHLIRQVAISTVNPLGAVSLVKTVDHSDTTGTPETVFTEGDLVPYSFLVTNTGSEPLHGLQVDDPKISDISCPADVLAPADSFTCTGTYGPLTSADVASGGFANTATVVGTTSDGDKVTDESSAVIPTYRSAVLAVTKHVTGSGSSLVGSDTAFTVHYSYPSGAYVPASTDASGQPNGYSAGSGVLTVTPGSTASTGRIPTGAIVTLTEDTPAVIPGAGWGAAEFSQNPVAIGDTGTTVVELDNPITAAPSFTVEKVASAASAKPGDTVTYTVTVRNTGPVAYTSADPAGFADDLSDVLDDATYNGDASGGAEVTGTTLAWAGALPVGGIVAITYSVTVGSPDSGNHLMDNSVVPTGAGGSCAAADGCATTTPIGGIHVVKTTTVTHAHPGEKVPYTIRISNVGRVAYTAADPASITDDISKVLDDATYDGDLASSSGGGASYTAPVISWSGPIGIGETVTLSYSVTVNSPDTGDHELINSVVTPSGQGNCPTGSDDPDCTVRVPSGSYTLTKTVSRATALPGDVLTYTVTVRNTGKVPYTANGPASFTDDLSEVLDDAVYNGDATGGAVVSGHVLTWTGALPVDGTASITYSVTVRADDKGDGSLDNVVVPTGPGGGCATSGDCATTTPVASYRIAKTASAGSAMPGDVVTYSVTVTNTGTVAYTKTNPASFTDDLSGVLDDAIYNGDADNGAVVAGDTLSWSGSLPPGGTAVITYSATVDAPDTGDHVLANAAVPTGPGGRCAAPGACVTATPVGSLQVAKTAAVSEASPGMVVPYTIRVTNTGRVPYTDADPASFTDDLSKVLDDATYNGDVVSSTGIGVAYEAPVISWAGALGIGETITITYSVTVDDSDNGDLRLSNTVVTPPGEGANCLTGSRDPDCTADIPGGAFTVAKTASAQAALPGGAIAYTVTVTNTGRVAYTAEHPASFSDDLSRVLDDATYNGDASAGATVKGRTLSWSGALPVGASVKVTYSVTVEKSDTGDHMLTNSVVPTAPGGSCDAAASCTTSTFIPAYSITKSADAVLAQPGEKVSYTVTVVNTGRVAYTSENPVSFSDDLSGVLDDAVYNGDVTGGATVVGKVLRWSGPLPVGGTVKIGYSVTVDSPDKGDHTLSNTATPTAPGGACAVPGSCGTRTPVLDYVVHKTVSAAAAAPGDAITYRIEVRNTGAVDYTGSNPASFTDDLGDALKLADYNGDADHGAVVEHSVLSWAGALPVGSSLTVSYSMTVKPDASGKITNVVVTPSAAHANCGLGSQDPGCATVTRVLPRPPGAAVQTGGYTIRAGIPTWVLVGGVWGVLIAAGASVFLITRRRNRREN